MQSTDCASRPLRWYIVITWPSNNQWKATEYRRHDSKVWLCKLWFNSLLILGSHAPYSRIFLKRVPCEWLTFLETWKITLKHPLLPRWPTPGSHVYLYLSLLQRSLTTKQDCILPPLDVTALSGRHVALIVCVFLQCRHGADENYTIRILFFSKNVF